MDILRLANHETDLSLDYDADADVLYLSLGAPKPAVGIDIGDGLVVRYDEARGEVVGLTVLNLRSRIASAGARTPGDGVDSTGPETTR